MNPAAVLSVLVQARGIEETNRRLRDIDKTSQKTARSTDKLERKFSNLDSTVGDFNRSMTAAGNVVKLVKFPAMIAGAGMAAQALGSLAAAGVAAGAALAPLAGASAGVAGGYLAMGQAAGVAKLAFSGLEDAISGNKDALKKLTPTQKEFVKQIQASAAEARGLRGVAQRGLLPGLTDALQSINPLFARLRPIVGGTATVMGQLARQAGALAGSDGVLDKISRIGRTNVAVIGHFGTGAIALGHALITVLDAARPLTLWFSNLAEKAGLWINGQTNIIAKSGALVGFFEQTRLVMSRLGRIIADVAVGLFNIAKAGKPLGDELLVKVVRLAEAFKDWTQSATGKNQIAEYFKNARGPILEITGLIGDIGGAILRLSRPTSGTGGLIAMFRPLVPLLEQVVKSTTSAFGPVLVGALANLLRVAAALAGTSGPLTLLVQAISAVAGAFAKLLNTVPGLNVAVVSILGFISVTKILTAVFGPLIAAIKALQIALIGEAAAANTAGIANLRMRASLVATAIAMYAQAAATKIVTAAQWLWNAALTANPIGLVIVALAGLVAGLVVAYKKSETFRAVVDAAWKAIRTTTMAVLNWLVPAVKVAWAVVSDVVVAAVKVVKAYVTVYAAAAKAIVNAILTAFDFLKGLAQKVFGFLLAAARKIGDTIKDFVTPALNVGKAIVKGIIDGLGSLGHLILDKVKDALDFVTDHLPGVGAAVSVGKAVGKLVGDGAGKTAGTLGLGMPSGAFGGGLMGARPSMGPFAAAGARFGLHVSSGRAGRENKLTSSGNVSYHSTGEAIDMAGSPAGMMGFFRQMKSRYGGRLAELIYGPGKIGIKDGKPYNFGGALNAQHMDHVHLAFDTGVPGVGDGIGRLQGAASRIPGTGDGLGDRKVIQSAATAGGIDPSILWGVWGAESNFSHGPGPVSKAGAIGPFQFMPGTASSMGVNPRQFRSSAFGAGRYLGQYKGRGTSGMLAAYNAGPGGNPNNAETRAYVPRVLKYARQWKTVGSTGGSGGGGGKGKTYEKNQTASGGGIGGYDPTATYATENSAAIPAPFASGSLTASAFANAQKSGVLGRPLKGGGPTKGFPSGYVPPTLPDMPTRADFLNADVARARLTDSTDDDIAALTNLRDLRKGEMDAALADSDPRNDADAIDAYLQVKDALDELKTSVDQSNRLQEQRDQLNQTIADNQTKILALAAQGPQIVGAVVAAVSGGIGGQVGLGLQTPGFAGGVARY